MRYVETLPTNTYLMLLRPRSPQMTRSGSVGSMSCFCSVVGDAAGTDDQLYGGDVGVVAGLLQQVGKVGLDADLALVAQKLEVDARGLIGHGIDDVAERELSMLFLRQGDCALHDRSLGGCAVECCEDALVTESHDDPFRCARRLGACADVFRSARACAPRSRARVLGLLYRNVRPAGGDGLLSAQGVAQGLPGGEAVCMLGERRSGWLRAAPPAALAVFPKCGFRASANFVNRDTGGNAVRKC